METSAAKANKNIKYFPLGQGLYVEIRKWRGEPRTTLTQYKRSHTLDPSNGTLNKKSINITAEQLDRIAQTRTLIHEEFKKFYEQIMFENLKIPQFYTPQLYPSEVEDNTQNVESLRV